MIIIKYFSEYTYNDKITDYYNISEIQKIYTNLSNNENNALKKYNLSLNNGIPSITNNIISITDQLDITNDLNFENLKKMFNYKSYLTDKLLEMFKTIPTILQNSAKTEIELIFKYINYNNLADNIGSPKQLGEILFIDLNIRGGKKTKTGTFSTDSSTLSSLSDQGYKIASLILDWRELTKLKSTYTDALQNQATKNNSRVHTSYGVANTLTGRLSSNDPNLQNIPIRTINGRRLEKHLFVIQIKFS